MALRNLIYGRSLASVATGSLGGGSEVYVCGLMHGTSSHHGYGHHGSCQSRPVDRSCGRGAPTISLSRACSGSRASNNKVGRVFVVDVNGGLGIGGSALESLVVERIGLLHMPRHIICDRSWERAMKPVVLEYTLLMPGGDGQSQHSYRIVLVA